MERIDLFHVLKSKMRREFLKALLAMEFGPEHAHLFIGGCRKYSGARHTKL